MPWWSCMSVSTYLLITLIFMRSVNYMTYILIIYWLWYWLNDKDTRHISSIYMFQNIIILTKNLVIGYGGSIYKDTSYDYLLRYLEWRLHKIDVVVHKVYCPTKIKESLTFFIPDLLLKFTNKIHTGNWIFLLLLFFSLLFSYNAITQQ